MRKENVACYAELLSWHLSVGTERHYNSTLLAFTWGDLGTQEIFSPGIYLEGLIDLKKLLPGIYLEGLRSTRNFLSRNSPGRTERYKKKLLPGIYLEGLRDTKNVLSRYLSEGTEKHNTFILPAFALRKRQIKSTVFAFT
jgi:hypothetical protein